MCDSMCMTNGGMSDWAQIRADIGVNSVGTMFTKHSTHFVLYAGCEL